MSVWIVRFRARGETEWRGAFRFDTEEDAMACYRAWDRDGIHKATVSEETEAP